MYRKIKSYLDANGLKYKAVAEKSEIDYAAFVNILSGNRTLKADELLRICEALDVPFDYFVEK